MRHPDTPSLSSDRNDFNVQEANHVPWAHYNNFVSPIHPFVRRTRRIELTSLLSSFLHSTLLMTIPMMNRGPPNGGIDHVSQQATSLSKVSQLHDPYVSS
jgi:hypothetical protein